ncbi:TIGR04283 family arsenosugar biosynthesis glycosyltransferase [Verrucomicrobiota bacterium]
MPALDHILLFARYPVSGQAKTRLIPALGADGAARLHKRMTESAVAAARGAAARGGTEITVCCTGGSRGEFRAWLGTDLRFQKQPGGDLGVRLRCAFARSFTAGARSAIVIGSDVPGLCPRILDRAAQLLSSSDVVLGPAADGGYYLLGVKRLHTGLLQVIDWGTDRVLAQTREAAARLGLHTSELPVLNDVDRPEDLPSLREDTRFEDVFTKTPLLSVVIPALDEEGLLRRTLARVVGAEHVEVIVADGGSADGTREAASRAGARVLRTCRGRAAQQNAGAAEAKGRHLLFLHADTLLPEGYADRIRLVFDDPALVAGAFRFRMDGSGPAIRLIEWGTGIRSRVFQWPYGDQGLFMEKRVFDEVGGFADLPIMEDLDLVRRLRRRGRIVTLPEAAVTSSRRWRHLGPLRTTLCNQAVVAGYLAGVPPERLARFYSPPGFVQPFRKPGR